MRRLERKPCSKLEHASRTNLCNSAYACEGSKRRVGRRCVSKRGVASVVVAMVKQIEAIRAHVELHALPQIEGLLNSGIHVIERRALSGVAREQSAVEERPVGGHSIAVVIHAGKNVVGKSGRKR